jgi:hypothetical protein
MLTLAHSERSDHSNLVKTISGIVATPFCKSNGLCICADDATYFLNDKRLPEDPTIIAGTDDNASKEICANEGATPLGSTLSGHTGLRTWHQWTRQRVPGIQHLAQ